MKYPLECSQNEQTDDEKSGKTFLADLDLNCSPHEHQAVMKPTTPYGYYVYHFSYGYKDYKINVVIIVIMFIVDLKVILAKLGCAPQERTYVVKSF